MSSLVELFNLDAAEQQKLREARHEGTQLALSSNGGLATPQKAVHIPVIPPHTGHPATYRASRHTPVNVL